MMEGMYQMKRIDTQGITAIEPLEGSGEWYWGTDYTGGDLYEAEELFQDGHPVKQNRLVLLHYPDGKVVQPVTAGSGQYLGRPVFYEGKIILLRVDFPAGKIEVLQYDTAGQVSALAAIPLSDVQDCYNIMLKRWPLMLTRQGSEDKFQILWPEKAEFAIGATEAFEFRVEDKLYFSSWHEDPNYREEVIVRDVHTGRIVDRIPGSTAVMPDGQIWLLG